jgi:hypothetical protein
VRRSAISAALVLGAVVANGAQARTAALYLLLAALPAVAITALSFFGDLVEGSADTEAGALYVGLTALAVPLVVIATAAQANTLDHASVPALGSSAMVAALTLLGLQLVVWTSLRLSRIRPVRAVREPAPADERDRLAA